MLGWGRETKKTKTKKTLLHTPPENMRRDKFLAVPAMERQTCAKTTGRARRSTGALAAAAQRGGRCLQLLALSEQLWHTMGGGGGGGSPHLGKEKVLMLDDEGR